MHEAAPSIFVGGLSCVWCFAIAFAGVIALGGTVVWIWALIDCVTKESDEGNSRLIWVLIIVFTHLIGAIIYFLVRRPQRLKELGR
jgi:hypothetical protein